MIFKLLSDFRDYRDRLYLQIKLQDARFWMILQGIQFRSFDCEN